MWDNNIAMWAEEIGMDGVVSLKGLSRSSIYRWTKAMNDFLKHSNYNWRVKANYKEELVEIIN